MTSGFRCRCPIVLTEVTSSLKPIGSIVRVGIDVTATLLCRSRDAEQNQLANIDEAR
jgi:hypothetical protein